MEDLLFIAATLGFFALGLAYVRFCDRIIGPDPVEAVAPVPPLAAGPEPELVEAAR